MERERSSTSGIIKVIVTSSKYPYCPVSEVRDRTAELHFETYRIVGLPCENNGVCESSLMGDLTEELGVPDSSVTIPMEAIMVDVEGVDTRHTCFVSAG